MIQKWLNIIQEDLGCFSDVNTTLARLQASFDAGIMHLWEESGGKGLVACFIVDDWMGNRICNELVVYLKPEYRGDGVTFPQMIANLEAFAKENGCIKVNLGATIGYRDGSILKVYKRLGYKTIGVSKSCVQE